MKEKILISIGDAVLANSIEYELGKLQYKTLVVHDGNKVIDYLKSFSPDLLIIDVALSGRSGYEVLSEKSFDRYITKIPVIIVSNSGVAIEMKRIPSTPTIKEMIIKAHIEPEEVLNKVEKVFGRESKAKLDDNVDKVNTGPQKKILWVEDDKLLSVILSKKFLKAGFILHRASNSDEAFAYLDKETPDVIVLDILLPGMNGIDILEKIRAIEKLRKIPAIILSNMNTQNYIDKAKFLGAKKFIVKAAASLEEIIREVKEVIYTK
jgi:DNA-binding response OmpR family regulator